MAIPLPECGLLNGIPVNLTRTNFKSLENKVFLFVLPGDRLPDGLRFFQKTSSQ
jgi:hypothetical protein